jgi:hypothetical protein
VDPDPEGKMTHKKEIEVQHVLYVGLKVFPLA